MLARVLKLSVPTFVVQEQAKAEEVLSQLLALGEAEEVLWRLFGLGYHVCGLAGVLLDVNLEWHWCTGQGSNGRRKTPSGRACLMRRHRRADLHNH